MPSFSQNDAESMNNSTEALPYAIKFVAKFHDACNLYLSRLAAPHATSSRASATLTASREPGNYESERQYCMIWFALAITRHFGRSLPGNTISLISAFTIKLLRRLFHCTEFRFML
jgi:hypothetical protein